MLRFRLGMFKGSLMTLISLAGILVLPPVSLAEDGKVYPGLMCQKSLGIGSYAGGAVRNDSTSGSLTVECPVVRDIVFGNVQDAQVRAYKATGSAFWCDLHTRSYYGTGGFMQHRTAGGTGYRTFSYTGMSDYNNGFYYFWCAIPPSASTSNKSRIISYRLDEQ